MKFHFPALPVQFKAIALAAWAEWATHRESPRDFSVSIRVNGKKAEVTAFTPFVHACADGETENVSIVDTRRFK
jgi:hypothetical protein